MIVIEHTDDNSRQLFWLRWYAAQGSGKPRTYTGFRSLWNKQITCALLIKQAD